jgi:hypothetical protein
MIQHVSDFSDDGSYTVGFMHLLTHFWIENYKKRKKFAEIRLIRL